MEKLKLASEQADREAVQQLERTARLVNMVLPVGWLPLGVMAAAEGRVLPSLLGLLGMTLIGTVSLWRAYRTTSRRIRGSPRTGKRRPAPAVAPTAKHRQAGRACCSKRAFPACRSRSRPSRWRASARSCGRPRRR